MSISIAAITLSAATVVAGNSVTGTIHLNAVPTFDVVAAVAVLPAADASVPVHVTIPKGCQTGTFQIAASATITAATSCVVNVNYNTTAQATLAIHPAPVPTFVDNFTGGTLNKNNWIISNYTASNYGGAGSDVTFTSSNIDLSQGMLRMELNQPTATLSTGAELQSKHTYGYGTYITVMRMASTANLAAGVGGVVSGSDSGIFNYINNSESEIDTEFCGNTPGLINYTNWNTLAKNQWTGPQIPNLSAGFHTYKMVWAPGQIQWYIDGTLLATHTQNVPSTPAFIMFNFWGTNHASWGGVATPGVTRYFYVKSVSFTPAQ